VTGPVLTGHLYDSLGSYRPGIILLVAVTSAIAAFLNLALPRYTNQESLEMVLSAVAVD